MQSTGVGVGGTERGRERKKSAGTALMGIPRGVSPSIELHLLFTRKIVFWMYIARYGNRHIFLEAFYDRGAPLFF